MTQHSAPTPPSSQAIVLFDGACNLCHGAVRFIIRRDPHERFRFGSLQSPAARNLLREAGRDPDRLDSLVLLLPGEPPLDASEAALRIAARLRPPWNAARVFLLLPRPLRDAVYRFIARRRIRWFGQRASCDLPTGLPERRFLSPPPLSPNREPPSPGAP